MNHLSLKALSAIGTLISSFASWPEPLSSHMHITCMFPSWIVFFFFLVRAGLISIELKTTCLSYTWFPRESDPLSRTPITYTFPSFIRQPNHMLIIYTFPSCIRQPCKPHAYHTYTRFPSIHVSHCELLYIIVKPHAYRAHVSLDYHTTKSHAYRIKYKCFSPISYARFP